MHASKPGCLRHRQGQEAVHISSQSKGAKPSLEDLGEYVGGEPMASRLFFLARTNRKKDPQLPWVRCPS